MGNRIRCPMCKEFYENSGVMQKMCPQCLVKEEELFQSVRTYIKEHPGVGIMETARATGISTKKVLAYLNDRRLDFS